MGRKKARICYDSIKSIKKKADKEKELQGKKEEEKERNERSAREELKQKLSLLKDEDDRAQKRMEVERSEKSTQEAAAEKKFEQEIFRRKDELDLELKRVKVEKEERKKRDAKREDIKRKISCRENDLDRALLVKNWKASAAELPPSTSNEKPTVAEQILEAAKRGPKHDLCEACGEELKFCVHEECTIIGCVACFREHFVACSSFDANLVCMQHCIKCFACGDTFCDQCHGLTCEFCETFTCSLCGEHSDFSGKEYDFSHRPEYCCPERKDMCEKSK